MFKRILWIIDWFNPYQLSEKIRAKQIKLIYQQLTGFTLLAESLVASVICAALWTVTNHTLLIGWLLYIYIASGLGRWVLIKFYFHKRNISNDTWLILFIFSVFIAGCSWGFVPIFLMPDEVVFYQNFIILIIFGVTAVATNFNAPVLACCALFLILAFVPLSIWFFLQGGLYTLLGFMSFLYIGLMFSTAYYTNKFFLKSLLLNEEVISHTKALKNSLALTTSILETTSDGILVMDLNKKVEYYNQRFLDMWKLSAKYIESHTIEEVIDKVLGQLENPQQFVEKIQYLFREINLKSFDILKFRDGKIYERYSKPRISENKINGRVWSFRDITERKKMEEKIYHQALHDTLTGLPNRTSLTKKLHQEIKYAKRFKTTIAILFIDIDNFKTINDSLGHDAGDILLQKIGRKLAVCMREIDTIFRFGGDEFVMFCLLKKWDEIDQVIHKIYSNLSSSIKIGTHDVIVTVSIGISFYPDHGNNPSTLIKNADIAMYSAKNQGRNSHQIYKQVLSQNLERRMTIQNYLHYAIENKEFFLVYQPILDLNSGHITSLEALLRWQHPKMGFISPNEFIPLAEESGLITQLGEWVMREACSQLKSFQKQGLRPVQVVINVSGIQISKEAFIKTIVQILDETQLDARYLEIELTESALMLDSKTIIKTLGRLKKMGIKIAIDDFGTGYSSFSYLKNFPVNKLKIDQSFIHDCAIAPNGGSIIKAIIAMGHHLDLLVLAEGVETLEQLRLLQTLGCDEIQGYVYSRPVLPQEIPKMLDISISDKILENFKQSIQRA
ncbi:inner membrane protein [Legionella sainthelensi]|uniref:cyclic-guanylate-specific phosphodiesterase n=2 Tax=Legionella sainthelensi TaxID=28087 RepID=A0A0W0YIN7_9GAMM|nr:inner membrane protein [Legionella sainthelensi]VEH34654.1 inner membrane protein [Legionella sainthelensi]